MLSSHLLYQVQEVCDRVGLFNRGKIVLEGTVEDLAQRVLGGAYRVKLQVDGASDQVENALRSLPGVVDVQHEDPNHLIVEAASDLRAEAARAIVGAGGRLQFLDVEAPSLDEIYSQYFEEVGHDAVA